MLDGSGTSDFTYDENTRLLTVNVGSIEPDTSRTVSLVATVNEDAYNTTIQNLAALTRTTPSRYRTRTTALSLQTV